MWQRRSGRCSVYLLKKEQLLILRAFHTILGSSKAGVRGGHLKRTEFLFFNTTRHKWPVTA
jgi:hypothetical protein